MNEELEQNVSQVLASYNPPKPVQDWELTRAFRNAMYQAGIDYIQDFADDGRLYKFAYGDSWNNWDKEGWYVFYGLAGAFGDRKRRIREIWSFDKERLSSTEIENLSKQIEEATRVASIAGKILNPCSPKQLLALDTPQRQMLLNPIIPEQGLVMIHAPHGLGKTRVALMIAYAVATGGAMFDGRWVSAQPNKVLMIDGDMPLAVMHEQLAKIMKSEKNLELKDDYLQIITPDLQEGGLVNLSTSYGQITVEDLLTDVKLLILDNYSSLCPGGDNDSKNWIQLQNWFLKLRRQGIAVLLIDFSNKSGRPRGTYRKEDVLDTIISLRKPISYDQRNGARFEVHYEKARGFHEEQFIPFEAWLKKQDDGTPYWQVHVLEKVQLEEIMALHNQKLPQREIAAKLRISATTVNRRLREAQMK
jgi:hypothetical protein